RALTIVDQPPGLLRVFEDEPAFLEHLVDGQGTAEFDATERFSGSGSLKVTPGEVQNAHVPGLGVRVTDSPKLGEYRYIRFAWRLDEKQGGTCLGFAHDGKWGKAGRRTATLFRYSSGPKEDGVESVSIDRKPPDQWVV